MKGVSQTSRILALTRYSPLGASSRVRFFQYLPFLTAEGISVDTSSLFDDSYLRMLYQSGRRQLLSVARAYVQRFRRVLSSGKYDLVWLEKECWPWLPLFADPKLLQFCSPYVVDYDDAIFHNYDESSSALVRFIFGKKIDLVMQRAELVVAGNSYLASRAIMAGARNIEIIPSVVDIDEYTCKQSIDCDEFVVGWIGSPSTQHFLTPLIPVLTELLNRPGRKFVTIGASYHAPLFKNHIVRSWNKNTEASDIASFDVGIMPLHDAPFERGKCGYKLIQYMACGLPVIGSPVGINSEIIRPGTNGFLAGTLEEWRDAIATLMRYPDVRRSLGASGRLIVEQQYCLNVTGPRLANLFRRVLGSGR